MKRSFLAFLFLINLSICTSDAYSCEEEYSAYSMLAKTCGYVLVGGLGAIAVHFLLKPFEPYHLLTQHTEQLRNEMGQVATLLKNELNILEERATLSNEEKNSLARIQATIRDMIERYRSTNIEFSRVEGFLIKFFHKELIENFEEIFSEFNELASRAERLQS